MTVASCGNLNVVTIMQRLEKAEHSKMCTIASWKATQLKIELLKKYMFRNVLMILQTMLKNRNMEIQIKQSRVECNKTT